MIPGTVVYVFIGTTIGSIQDAATGNYDAGVAPLILVIVGSILACVAIVYISIVVKRYLNQAMEQENNNDNSEENQLEADSPYIVNHIGTDGNNGGSLGSGSQDNILATYDQ